MTAHAKVGGSFAAVQTVHCKVAGSWNEVTEGHTKIAGDWKQFYASVPPVTASTIYSVTDTHSFVSHSSSSVSTTMTLDSNTDREIWLVVLTIATSHTSTPPTATIGGNSMTQIANQYLNFTSITYFRYQDDGALGTSATTEANLDYSSFHSAFIVYTATASNNTLDTYGAATDDGSTPTTGSLDTSADGWAFYVATAQNSTAATSISNFGNQGFFDYGTGENIAYGFNSPEDDGTVSVVFANFTGASNDNVMLAVSRNNT